MLHSVKISALLVSCLTATISLFTVADAAEPRDIAFTARVDQTEQRYVLVLPEPLPSAPCDLMIALHGHGSDRWQFVKGDFAEARAARDFAARHQMIYVSPDYRAKTSWMGPHAEADLLQIIDDLKKTYQVKRVFLCGASMGGSSVLTFAALHPELVNGVISMNGTCNHLLYEKFQEAISASFGGTKAEIPEEYKKRSAEYWPERLTMPLGMTVGGLDTVVPPDSVRRLAKVLQHIQRPVLLVDRETGGHSTTYEDAMTALEFVFIQAK